MGASPGTAFDATARAASDVPEAPDAPADATRVRDAEADRDVARSLQARFAFLAEASRCLADSLDYDATLATVAGLALPHLGAWCIVDIIETGAADHPDVAPAAGTDPPDCTMRRLAVLHPDPQKQALARELHERYPPAPADLVGAPRVIRTGRPEIVLDVPDAALEAAAQDGEHLRLLRELGVRAYLIVPMVARGRMVGAITFVTADREREFGDADLLLAEDLARRCAMAVDNARLYHAAVTARADATAASAEAENATRVAHEARDVAAAANRAKAEFMAVMSHELRTPLNAIGGYAELLELGIRGPMTEPQLHDLQRIQRAQKHLAGLIEQVLSYARVEAGRVRCELTDVAVHEAVLTAEVLVSPQLRAKGLSFAWGSCDAGLTVRADRAWLHQILVNLLANAIKFTESGGHVAIHCDVRPEFVELRIADSGIGVPSDKLEAIFEPFMQVGRRLNDPRPHEGVGLGLAISRDLARRMGGDLRAASEEGKGSTFTFTVARAPSPAATSAERAS
jgi:signal transduction histidine kinase